MERFWGTYLNKKLGNSLLFAVVESLTIVFALYLGDIALYLIHDIPVQMKPALLLVPAWWCAALGLRLWPGWGMGAVREFRLSTLALSGIFGLAAFGALMEKSGTLSRSRISFIVAYLVCLFMIPMVRSLCKRVLIDMHLWGIKAVMYGDAEDVHEVIDLLKKEKGFGYMPSGVYCDPRDPRDPRDSLDDLPILGNLSDMSLDAPVAIVAHSVTSAEERKGLLTRLMGHYRTVLIVPTSSEYPSLWVQPRDLQGILALEVSHNLLDPLPRLLKRALELSAVLVAAPLWVPVVLICALLVWLGDRGNPFYYQKRRGIGGRIFRMVKLRSMVQDSEAALEKALLADDVLRAEWERDCKLRSDPRITAVGRFMRRTSLDEVPQLFNVLCGDMALVGPRPLPDYHIDKLPADVVVLRDRVRPGITGMWQVSGRSDAGTEGMEKWDGYYVRNWSVWLDAVILIRTLRVLLSSHGAY